MMTILTEAERNPAPTSDDARGSRPHRSVSQYNAYRRCPHMYWLKRVRMVAQRPDLWSPQGKAVHRAIESFELSRRQRPLEAVQAVFTDTFDWEVSRLLEETPNWDYWAPSGRYRGEADFKRRRALGIETIRAYLEWCEARPDQRPILLDGRAAVEVKLEFQLGDVPILAYVDQVIESDAKRAGERLRVRDVKTGSAPSEHLQLGTYAVGLSLVHGIEVTSGDYWYGTTGRPSRVKDLAAFSEAYLTDEFGRLDEDIRSGRFDPAPDAQKCRSCSVNAACSARAL